MNTNETLKKANIQRFYANLKLRIDIYQKAKKDLDTYLANDFNVFDYINPNENGLSDVIADLLNPHGKHGQKSVFLKELLNLIGVNLPYDILDCKIHREYLTSHISNSLRRMDITLTFEDCFEIAIENKPWAIEQKEQLQDYQKHLSNKYGQNYCLIYLSGDGSEPTSIHEPLKSKLIAEKKLVVISYENEIKDWLTNCFRECKAEKIRMFINDFIKYIEDNFENQFDYIGGYVDGK